MLSAPLKIYVGFDQREKLGYDVTVNSIRRRASKPIDITPLKIDRLRSSGLLRRPTDTRSGIYDITSNAPASTEFALSRFVLPIIGQTGFVLFAEPDMVFLDDVAKVFAMADPRYAVQCVQHEHEPRNTTKMDGAVQSRYYRKNWSSLMLINCDHPGNARLSLEDVNNRRGLELHQFYWLHDSEIGSLPFAWNWLVGEQPKPERPHVAHFTNGGPFLANWLSREHDEIWLEEASMLEGVKW